MHATALIFGIILSTSESAGPSDELEPPLQVTALDEPIDIQREGQACPVFADFDGDGLNDLLVGEAYSGRLRIYQNLGTKTEPKFGEYEWFVAGNEVAHVPWARGGYKGFTPQVTDLDGDGKTDIISGTHIGEIHWFRRIEGTTFAPSEKLVHIDGKTIAISHGGQPSCCDWDGDGDIDIVIGTLEGDVLLLENLGSVRSPRFSAPVPVLAGGRAISVASRYAHPCVADWDGDGRIDLLVGALDGSVVFYRNQGTSSAPQFDRPITLVPKSPVTVQQDNQRPPGQSGMQPALCVADFNGDGRPDLLLGDGCGRFQGPARQSPEELQRAEQNQSRLASLRKEWADAFQRYRDVTRIRPKLKTKNAIVESRISALRAEIEKYNSQITAAQQDVEYDWPRNHLHGFVWVFIRRPADKK
jgi:hypothetical protein